ncbi:mandelate racemase/muconate lactonizing enzyme family protein [Allopusillimonas ginsengisoli]|uniref:mandelate racemase/muconate lactonizing enzyme family protein n=1 Tax=Allopusillimonas ginsengisoli TaxID=453575 RepID=UPI001021EC14|nr:mandelate racemase/muconate lactonizing enzyme family protein [Allopusillimonas ginsengisoli]TEA79051.1 mandelate racemase/muconate lactonizing enzyme family protein [Allopusillimonas ginsengisoli]
MKIAHIETFLFYPGSGKNLLFCRVETDDGHYGWGESYVGVNKEKIVDEYLRAMAPYIVGRSPFNIRHLGQIMFDDFAIRRTSVDFLCAWSAIEIALWDIVGKATGQPVHNLLGGASREQVRVYANGWWYGAGTIDEIVQRAVEVKEMGYTALKWDPFPGPWRTFVSRQEEDHAVECVRQVRKALGPDMDLLIDAHRRVAPYHSIRVARRLEEFDIFCFEEPCLSDNIALVAEVRTKINTPVVTGETLYTKEQFSEVLAARAADILNPDICAVGGILQMLDIAAMAHPHAVAISPHNYNSTIVGLAATIHYSAMISNFVIAECFINLQDACNDIAVNRIEIKDGWMDIPTAPGLGVDMDVEVMRRRPYKAFPSKGMRQYWEEFPRKNYVWGMANVTR